MIIPKEQSDNTRVVQIEKQTESKPKLRINREERIFDTSKANAAQRQQAFINDNYFGNGTFGYQTQIDPTTQEGQKAIQAQYNYSKDNMIDFVTSLGLEGLLEGFSYIITPIKIGSGAEAEVFSRPFSRNVTKISTKSRKETELLNSVPLMERSQFVDANDGLLTFKQRKLKTLSAKEEAKALQELDKNMLKRGWHRLTHPNLYGPAYTNGKYVISDIIGNIGKTRTGKYKMFDASLETPLEWFLAMERNGGKILKTLIRKNNEFQ